MQLALTFLLLAVIARPALATPPAETPIAIVSVKTSSHLKPWKGYTFDGANLIDGNVETSWQPAKNDTLGVGQWIALDLGQAYDISRIEIAQGLQKTDPKLGDLFCRNNRASNIMVWLDDGTVGQTDFGFPPSAMTLEVRNFYRAGRSTPGNEVRTAARHLRLIVREVLEPVDWDDLAIAEVRVFGRPVATTDSGAGPVAWDQAGSWPLRTAISDFCAVSADKRAKRGCAELLRMVNQNANGDALPKKLPTIEPEAIERGEVTLTFGTQRVWRVELARSAKDLAWVVKTVETRAKDGVPSAYGEELWYTNDFDGDNPCWERLGKPRNSDD